MKVDYKILFKETQCIWIFLLFGNLKNLKFKNINPSWLHLEYYLPIKLS